MTSLPRNPSETATPTPRYLMVRVVSSKGDIYQGEALSVSAANITGNFDILPGHANFITLVQKTPIYIRTKNQTLTYNFPFSIIYNCQNRVNIYTDLYFRIES